MTARNPKSGITLLETLIALAVMSMLAVLLTSGLGFGIRALDRSSAMSAAIEEAAGRRQLRIWLEHALLSGVPLDERPLFVGSRDRLTFLAEVSDPRLWAGAAVEVSLGTEGPEVRGVGVSADRSSQAEVGVRIAHPETDLAFSYWGQILPDPYQRWHDTWPANAGLPLLVRISFGDEPGALPPMSVRPAKALLQSEMSLSSLVPPALPSRP